jgi:hypothetical protein
MPELVTLKHVADLIVDRVLAESKNTAELSEALENAYPFADHPEGRQIWIDALFRHAIEVNPTSMHKSSKGVDCGKYAGEQANPKIGSRKGG